MSGEERCTAKYVSRGESSYQNDYDVCCLMVGHEGVHQGFRFRWFPEREEPRE